MTGPLSDVQVLDLTNDRGELTGSMLADLYSPAGIAAIRK